MSETPNKKPDWWPTDLGRKFRTDTEYSDGYNSGWDSASDAIWEALQKPKNVADLNRWENELEAEYVEDAPG